MKDSDDDDDDCANDTWVESGAHASAYTGLELVARVDLSIPLLLGTISQDVLHNFARLARTQNKRRVNLLHILTAPSSPPVTIPAPSQLHRPQSAAPLRRKGKPTFKNSFHL